MDDESPVTPVRVTLSRRKGWRIPANTVKVSRPGRWGNPFRVGMYRDYTAEDAVRDYQRWLARDLTVRSAELVYGPPPSREEIVAALKGRNLACWCKPGCACHGDVLLKIANEKESIEMARDVERPAKARVSI